jgi:hypothetical protein
LTSLHHDMALIGASCLATGVGCMAPLARAQRMAMLSPPQVNRELPSAAQSTPKIGALECVAAAATKLNPLACCWYLHQHIVNYAKPVLLLGLGHVQTNLSIPVRRRDELAAALGPSELGN